MPLIMPEPRYFSIPSSVVGAAAFRKAALNCRPWVRSLIQTPEALTNSPAETRAAWPTTVARSRCPRTFTRSTQNPVSALWKVTRSTKPDRTSVEGAAAALLVPSILVWPIRGRAEDARPGSHMVLARPRTQLGPLLFTARAAAIRCGRIGASGAIHGASDAAACG